MSNENEKGFHKNIITKTYKVLEGNGEQKVISVVPQVKGRQQLRDFLLSNKPFTSLSPILLTDLYKRPNALVFFLGNDMRDLSLPMDVIGIYEKSKELLAVPKRDERFGYTWLEFFSTNDDLSHSDQHVASVRLNTESKQVESQGWYGPERQAFFDYVSGKLVIDDPNTLPAFSAKVTVNNRIIFGKVNNNSEKYIIFKVGSSSIEPNSQVTLKPSFDDKTGYFWLEGFDKDSKQVFTRQVVKNERTKEIGIKDWPGVELHSIVEWMKGSLSVDKTHIAMYSFFDKKTRSIQINNIPIINFEAQSIINGTSTLFLIPKEKGPYKWLEICQIENSGDNQKILAQVRIEKRENDHIHTDGYWVGPEKQAILDYASTGENKDLLTTFSTTLLKTRVIHLGKVNGKTLRIVLPKNFPEGEKVVVVPRIDNNTFYIDVYDNEQKSIIKTSRWDGTTFTFYDNEIFTNEKIIFIADKSTGRVSDENNVLWIPLLRFAKEYGVHESVVQKYCESLSYVLGKGTNGKMLKHYNEKELEELLKKDGIFNRKKRVVKPKGFWTPDRIEEYVQDLLTRMPDLSRASFRSIGQENFIFTITSYYPGGLGALRQKFEIINEEKEEKTISPDIANSIFQRLFEGEKTQ